MLRIDVGLFNRNQLETKKYSLSAALPDLDLPGERLAFAGPVNGELQVTGSEDLLTVEGLVTGSLNLRCVRCLESFTFDFRIPFREVYTHKPTDETGEEVQYTGDCLDLSPEILKAVILTLPMKALCREDCLGLCPTCGCNLNQTPCACTREDLDPRFNVLQDLFKNNS